jgi:hypothetical protein
MLPRRRSLSLSLSPFWNFCEDPDTWMYNKPLHPLSVSSALRFELFPRFFFFTILVSFLSSIAVEIRSELELQF